MVRRGRLRDLAVRPHLPERTVRLRLTALYCGLFFPLGVVLVVITSVVTVLVAHVPSSTHPASGPRTRQARHPPPIQRSWGERRLPLRRWYISAPSASTSTSSSSVRASSWSS